jgi:hypothetical protein
MKRIFVLAVAGLGLMATAALADPAPAGDRRAPPSKEDMARFQAQRCSDMYARAVGRMAYLEAKLSLSSGQASAFDAWKELRLHDAKDRSAHCASMDFGAMRAQRSPLDRMHRMEDRMKARLASLQNEEPVFAAFYNSLNDDQKKMLDMRGRMGGRGRFGMHGRGHDKDHGADGGGDNAPDNG